MTLSPLVLNGPVLYSTGLVLVLFIVRKLFFAKSKLPLPPGPKGIPIFGNIGDLPPPGVTEWEHWRSHKDLYGPISSVTVLGTTIILLHDAAITLELLEKRSSKTSSRPHQTFSSDL